MSLRSWPVGGAPQNFISLKYRHSAGDVQPLDQTRVELSYCTLLRAGVDRTLQF